MLSPHLVEDPVKYYELLEVPRNASWPEIQSAYHELARVWHPDRFVSDRRLQQRAARKMQTINEAYQKLEKLHGSPACGPAQSSSEGPLRRPAESTSSTGSSRSAFRAKPEFSNILRYARFRRPSFERSKFDPPWLGSAMLVLAAVLAIAGWLVFLRFLSTPPHRPRSPAVDPAASSPFARTIDVVATPDPKPDPGQSPAPGAPRSKARSNPGTNLKTRPASGAELMEPQGPGGGGVIHINNRRDEDIIFELWQLDNQRRMVRQVYIRSREEVEIEGIGLGVYRAAFKPAVRPESLPGRLSPPVNEYRLEDSMQFYEIRGSLGTQSVRYVITVP